MDQVTNPNAGVRYRGSLCVADAHQCMQIHFKFADVRHHRCHGTHVLDQAFISQGIKEKKEKINSAC